MTSLTSGRFQLPLNLTEGNTIDFVFRLSNNGVLFTPALTPVWIFGIKDADDPNGDFLIQVNSATAASGVFTFVVELASAELQTWLATATSQSYAAIQITDSANDIATGPLLCQIAPNQNDTGTTPTSANGTLSVAAGKTVTFPQSLTFPSALGTNGFQLTTDGAGALTWTAGGALTDGDKGEITVSASGATWTIDNDVVTLAKLAHMATARVIGRTTGGTGSPELLTISGTGSVAMTNTPTLVTPVLGAATATSINGITISAGGSGTLTMLGNIDTSASGFINTNTSGGSISTQSSGGNINTSTNGGSINTSQAGGSIDTRNTGSIELGYAGTRTTFRGNAASSDKTIDLPNATGTVAVAATSATATQALFATATAGAPAYRAIATADIATALTTPGAIGGTTPSTGAFTTLSATGVASVTDTTNATSTTAASLKTAGGIGVVKDAWFGGSMRFATNGAGGAGNIFLGTAANRAGNGATTTGAENICVGNAAGFSLTSGASNVCLGDQAGSGLTSNSSYNMCIGYVALANGTSGADYNVAIGAASLFSVTNGDNNVGIGRNAGNTVTTGGNNTFIGYDSDGVATLSNQTAIGTGATCTAASQVMLGTATEIVTLPGGLVTVPVAQTASTAAVSVAVTTTALTTTAPAQAITLANGTNGQIKIITHIASSGGGTAVLTPATSAADYNTITFSSVGDTATLQYHTTGGWYILSLRGAVAA